LGVRHQVVEGWWPGLVEALALRTVKLEQHALKKVYLVEGEHLALEDPARGPREEVAHHLGLAVTRRHAGDQLHNTSQELL
jgi:hypothetical protein